MKKLLITDVDNTLFDWQRLWFETFSAMAMRVLEISGVDSATFYQQCSAVHQKYGTSEYAFVLSELPCLVELYGGDLLQEMQPAIDDFREARRKYLRLYDGVLETLQRLKGGGLMIAAFTESKAFYTNYRFRKLGLDGLIDFLYSPADHSLPAGRSDLRKYDEASYQFKETVHRFTPEGEVKPNPHILTTIIGELGFTKSETVYVGDNLLKDVFMAQQAGVLDVYAAYGAAQHREEEYDLLKKVTHWTPEMIAREKAALKPGAITPTRILRTSFSEIESIVRGEHE
ncbi:MAG: HAD hydrolase-like protein [Sphingomonadales bacterium]|nr:HAD hydrolase-like protein [Sphingomonadales bacterium]